MRHDLEGNIQVLIPSCFYFNFSASISLNRPLPCALTRTYCDVIDIGKCESKLNFFPEKLITSDSSVG